ncbi:transcription factor Gibbin isoform X1 [Lepisosteus oculatus]|uniref:transcription factor Gibbin isoform X1 n=2 Tax=Lepisosteus oculatus TaxID=7918 RepID=UPI0035F52F2F
MLSVKVASAAESSMNQPIKGKEEIQQNIATATVEEDDDTNSVQPDASCRPLQGSGVENGGCEPEAPPLLCQGPRAFLQGSGVRADEAVSIRAPQRREQSANSKHSRARDIKCNGSKSTVEDSCVNFLDSQEIKRERKQQIRPCSPLSRLASSTEEPPKTSELACHGKSNSQPSVLPLDGYNREPLGDLTVSLTCSPQGAPTDTPDTRLPHRKGGACSLENLKAKGKEGKRALNRIPSATLLSPGRGNNIDGILTLLRAKCGNGRINLCPVVQLIDITKEMSQLSGRLRSSAVRVGCGSLSEDECLELEGQGGWGESTAATGASLHYSFFSSPSLANGLRSPEEQIHKRPKIGPRRQRQPDPERLQPAELPQQQLQPSEPEPKMEKNEDPPAEPPADQLVDLPNQLMSVCPITETTVPLESPLCEAEPATNQQNIPECLPVTPLNTAPVLAPQVEAVAEERHSEVQQQPPVPRGNPSIMPHPENERKYALRSSGRPRFPCHLRKSSRLRRALEGVTKDEKERPSKEIASMDNSRGRAPAEKSWKGDRVTEALEVRRAEQDDHKGYSETPSGTHSRSEETEMASTATRSKRKGKCVGIRKFVVKVARIPIHMSRRHKSYKISSMESPVVPEGSGGTEEREVSKGPQREPTALLKMKNNGKNVMVMFPPGELPVILKRRRGRPPKQIPPGQPDPREVKAGEVKKPRRRRRVKLPSPLPSYVADTNDAKSDYGDVLSKLAFLNRQPPTTGRCSPPRCWTPSEPESLQQPPENPNISTLLHRLQGFRRRGGRAGCMGGRGGLAGSSESFKRSFSDFFETIGKKRKTPPTDPTQPRKRGKPAAVEHPRVPPGEKVVRKRRPRKNGILKAGQVQQGQEWTAENSWVRKADGRPSQSERGPGYQGSSSPRGFATCDSGKSGYYSAPPQSNQESQGLFAGYFRSLLDSDDSSDLLDFSMSNPAGPRGESRKVPGCYETGSPAQSQRWSPAFPKRCPKASPSNSEGTSQPPNPGRPPYPQGSSYNLSQTSPTSFQKAVPPLSLSRSPSSPHPSGSYPHYSSFGSGSQAGSSPANSSLQPLKQYEGQRLSDCNFPYGGGNNKALPTSPSSHCNMGYSSHHTSNTLGKRGYGFQSSVHSASALLRAESHTGAVSPGGFMATRNNSYPFPLDSCRQYSTVSQWSYRPSYQGNSWNTEIFCPQYPSSYDYNTSSEPKDILDISNYTPQKAKQRSFSETFSESSSDSSHLGQSGASAGYKQQEPPPSGESQSSLSSLEKLMMDWNESTTGPSYNWNQSVLFQGGTKPGRGRRKKAEAQGESHHLGFPSVSSPSSSSSPVPGPKRSTVGARQPRGSRGGFTSCRRERATLGKPKAQKATSQPASMTLFQDSPDMAVDYYSGDSSSMSPLPAQAQGYGLGEREQCEYSSPYSVNPSTPSSEDRFSQMFHSEAASLSPVVALQPEPTKPFHSPPLKPPHAYTGPPKTFSPSCSPTLAYKESPLPCDARRLLSSCAAQSPHRASKDLSHYDSPSYSGSPYWYPQGGSLAGSPHHYDKRDEFAERVGVSPQILSSIPLGHTEKESQEMGRVASLRVAAPPSPYPPLLASTCAATLDNSPIHEEHSLHLPPENYHPRYPPLSAHGQLGMSAPLHRSGVLCQLLDQPTEDNFTVTSL